MGLDMTSLLFSGIVFFIYSAACLLSLIFTFSIDLYRQIEDGIGLEIFSNPIINPLLESNMDWIDAWGKRNHKIIGPIFVFFSIIDMHFWFKFINFI